MGYLGKLLNDKYEVDDEPRFRLHVAEESWSSAFGTRQNTMRVSYWRRIKATAMQMVHAVTSEPKPKTILVG